MIWATLDRRTRALHRVWTSIAIAAALVAAFVVAGAGGRDAWVRLVVGAVSVAAVGAACRERARLSIGIGLGALNAAVIPTDAVVDRTVVTTVAALALLLAGEACAVAQRLVTSATVTSTRSEAVRVGVHLAAATAGTVLVLAVAQLDRLGPTAVVATAIVVAGIAAWRLAPTPPA